MANQPGDDSYLGFHDVEDAYGVVGVANSQLTVGCLIDPIPPIELNTISDVIERDTHTAYTQHPAHRLEMCKGQRAPWIVGVSD